ncbi:Vesicle-associated protein 2-1 [Nymphaea thermarum]|nr:Vesicle-associated protein 2-1 [Nymphaea thermarum]
MYVCQLSTVELEKQSYCNLKLVNNREHHVAFKIKTTSPKKYFVRPTTGIILPWDSIVVLVTLQAQRECPPDMQCKDKFLVQSTVVPPSTDSDDIPPDTFNKDAEGKIEECKLKVVYTAPSASNGPGSLEDHLLFHSSMLRSSKRSTDSNSMCSAAGPEEAVAQLKEEIIAALQQRKKLQQELDNLKQSKLQKRRAGLSIKLIFIAGLVGILIGYILSLSRSMQLGSKLNAEL